MRKLDLNKLRKNRKSAEKSLEEALAEVEPFDWPEDVLSGKKKVVVSGIEDFAGPDERVSMDYVDA